MTVAAAVADDCLRRIQVKRRHRTVRAAEAVGLGLGRIALDLF